MGDPAHPMATGEFQTASGAYREALAPHCPGFDLDYRVRIETRRIRSELQRLLPVEVLEGGERSKIDIGAQ
ncbi:hypothetical protein [Celeribacter indicus]|uniref:hypothetical protein n=1 Tax=Celeribacter indicus TaxID=1208324 RepID=UPI0011147A18|nr:hypothetical protein [Celeribacter indicus]